MITFAKTPTRQVRLVLLCIVCVTAGCHPGPEVRLTRGPEDSTSIAEGRRLLENGRAVEAVTAFRRLLRQNGSNLKALNGLAIAYGELGKTDLATEMFSRALALAPSDPATLNNIGFAALRRADALLARRYLTRAQHGDGDLQEIEGNLARLARLEKTELTSASVFARPGPTPQKAAWIAEDRRWARAVSAPPANEHVKVATVDDAGTAWRSADMIVDFTTVIDPFADVAAGE